MHESYRQAVLASDEGLAQARAELIAVGGKDELAAVDELERDMSEVDQELEKLWGFALTVDRDARIERAQQEMARLGPLVTGQIAKVEQLAEEQQAKLAAERAAADRAADMTLWLLVGFSTAAFVTGGAAVGMLVVSVVRPLTSLRASARAITSGDLEVKAEVSGPEEVASLARDFNMMVAERLRAKEGLRESEERYRRLSEASLEGIAIHERGQILEVNQAFVKMFGYELSEVIRMRAVDLTAPESRDVISQRILSGYRAPFEAIGLKKDGSTFPAVVHARPMPYGGRVVSVAVIWDITERKRAEEALRESEAKYRQIFENVQDIFYQTDATGIITEISPSVERYGYTREGLIGTQVLDVYENPEERSAFLEVLVEQGEVLDYEVRLKAADGRAADASVSSHLIRGPDGTPVGVEGTLRDITHRKRLEEALREQARRDPLTGVLNHAAIVQELRGLLSDGGDGASLAVAMVDVNDLKAINDTYGHQVGDVVLATVAGALSRDGAIVGRYGGDEFVAVLRGTGRETAERYREEVLAALAGAGLTDPESGASVPVVVSIGLATYPTEAGRIEELIKLADGEMYAAKRQRPVGSASRALPRPLGSGRAAKMVGEIVPLLTSPGDLDEKLRLVAHRLSIAAGYDGVSFQVYWHPLRAPTALNAFSRVPDELVEAWNREQRQSEAHPLRDMLERTRRPLMLDDPQHDPRLTDAERELLRAAGLRSALLAPMLWQNELIGEIAVASKQESAFGPRDAEFLMAVASQVTAIVRMATLVDELESASARLAQAQTETVMLLAAAAEAHDQTTGPHLQNVRAITEALARELGYSEEDAQELGLAAVLHDIGKIRVPDSVLASRDGPGEEEWELLKNHTIWGSQLLAGRLGFELAATIARSHHERWDGSGYPDGLSGEAIPEAATIVAVADAFDAMTTGRPYRARRSIVAAVREIVACSGKQFSPRVVQALVRLHKRKMLSGLRRQVAQGKQAA